MESEGEAIPVTQKEENNLSGAEAYSYLTKAGNVYKNFTRCTNPPVWSVISAKNTEYKLIHINK